jgi:hypothetical protein
MQLYYYPGSCSLAAYHARIAGRPAVQAAMQAEGLAG